jgi:hypothetical protein
MPQERTLLYTGREFEVEHVRSHAHGHEWSAPYVMAPQRIVFPISRAMLDLRLGNDTWLVDGLTTISFGDAVVYQLRPGAQAARRSVVVSRHRRSRHMRHRLSASSRRSRSIASMPRSSSFDRGMAMAMRRRLPRWSTNCIAHAG